MLNGTQLADLLEFMPDQNEHVVPLRASLLGTLRGAFDYSPLKAGMWACLAHGAGEQLPKHLGTAVSDVMTFYRAWEHEQCTLEDRWCLTPAMMLDALGGKRSRAGSSARPGSPREHETFKRGKREAAGSTAA